MAIAKGEKITDMLYEILNACGTIEEAHACDSCPMRYNCLDTESFGYISSAVPAKRFDELLGFAADIDNYSNEQDAADYWDTKRKADIEERMIDMEWGY